MKKPNQTLTIITDGNQANRFQYVIIGKSKAGRYINAGFSHSHWDIALHEYLKHATKWLAGLKLDSLQSVVVVTNDQLNYPNVINALDTGLEPKAIGYYADHNASCSDNWGTNTNYHSYKEISSNMMAKYDGKLYGDYLITLVTGLNFDFIFACKGFASGTLTNIWERTTATYCAKHKDEPNIIILSKKDNSHHMAIIEQLLQTRQRLNDSELQRMIGKTPPPPTTPPITQPPAPITPVSHASNDAIHRQTGNARLMLLIFIAIIALLCLPMQCAVAYTEILSQSNSGQASRYLLAFFVSDNCLASQAKQINSTAPIYYPTFTKQQGNTVYDGVTSQNTKALGRICGAVSIRTESEPRHLIPIEPNQPYNVTLTQNLIGDSYHG